MSGCGPFEPLLINWAAPVAVSSTYSESSCIFLLVLVLADRGFRSLLLLLLLVLLGGALVGLESFPLLLRLEDVRLTPRRLPFKNLRRVLLSSFREDLARWSSHAFWSG